MIFRLLCIILIGLPFVLTFDLSPLLPAMMDFRYTKEALSFLLAGGVVCAWLWSQPTKIRIPKPLIALLGYCIYRCIAAPQFSAPLLNQSQVLSPWQYKSIADIFLYGLLFLAISNTRITTQQIDTILNIFLSTGVAMAIYCVAQFLHLDPWQYLLPTEENQLTPSAWITGTLSHVTLAAAYLLFGWTASLSTGPIWCIGLLLVMILICQSDVAAIAMIGIFCWLLWLHSEISRRITVWLVILGCVGAILFSPVVSQRANGRLIVWQQITQDLVANPLNHGRSTGLTGYGLGAYQYLFTAQYTTEERGDGIRWIRWEHAHNDFLEWAYNTGVVGLILLFVVLFSLLQSSLPIIMTDVRYLAFSGMLVGMCICACGTFVWHVEPFRIFTVIVAALLQNKIYEEEESCAKTSS